MKLKVLISKKGTQVVTATNLHNVLQLPYHHYNKNVGYWIRDYYAFGNDVRQPKELKDYAIRPMKHSKQKDYYLSLEMARLITLSSKSMVKQSVAKLILTYEKKEVVKKPDDYLTKEQILAVVELTKVMGLISCQQSAQKQHQKYFDENPKNHSWWKYRAGVLGYSVETLQSKMKEVGKVYKSQTVLKMLFQLDKYEIIRMAVIDLFISLGKSKEYSKDMGDLAKAFAKEMKVEIWDDRKASLPFYTSNVDMGLVQEVKNMNRAGLLGLW